MNAVRGIVAICGIVVAVPALAMDSAELTVGAGMHLLGEIDAAVDIPLVGIQYGTIDIRDSAAYTAILDLPLRSSQGARLELRYSYQPTRLMFESSPDYDLFDLDVHTLLAGIFMERAPANSTVVPYAGFSLGATLYDPDTDREGETRFTGAVTLGVTKYVSEKMGLTMRADFLMPIDWGGGGMWVGSSGATVTLGGTSYMAQIGLGAALTYRLGR
jgi:hypothetical protein